MPWIEHRYPDEELPSLGEIEKISRRINPLPELPAI